ncbi:PDZ domain-containing protein [Nocardioides terrae]|uniref:PDZ domain-containing protein n=1 Tax=Nocardioides terrae TaxID=574651 RepID=A0A1I1DG65_9ACTN|nr:PDZ domain-containing protein [Nocardioides terrae]SFB73935.1 PDZ domain-containing protein [Nocardioides terrae]
MKKATSMTQRTIAGLVAVPLVIALLVVAWLSPLPYVVYRPGVTVDVLGKSDGKPIIDVEGHQVFRDDGQLRMTTVSVSRPDTKVRLPELLGAWVSKKDAVYPWDAVYQTGTSDKESRQEGAAQMASSQDVATAVALHELGQDVPEVVTIADVGKGEPADGRLKPRDVLVSIDGAAVTSTDQGIGLIRKTPAGQPLDLLVRRDGKEMHVSVTPTDHDGTPRIGATVGAGYDFPFDVSIGIDPAIGGPSAGLMFSLAIFDVLTPGSLTGGQKIAGTGEIEPDGSVGPIGGIQQKIAASDRDGARLFLVPKDNCDEAVGAARGDVRLVEVTTMHDAVTSVETWTKDHDAKLPTCGGGS